jgi:predicted RNA-binding Zn-ribbon protein involved in translation (DUF1610 family)
MSKKFTRKIENFTCENCNMEVIGSGYTNHCPQCLWSKHIDVFPGDRGEKCRGLMKPIALLIKKKQYVIAFQCMKCGQEHTNKCTEGDNIGILLKNY